MVGIIDSGIGGLSVLKTLLAAHPKISFVYHADSMFAPYGDKTPEFLRERVNNVVHYHKKNYNTRIIILACNTSSAVVFPFLRDTWNREGIYVVDIITAGIRAVQKRVAKESPVGVLATTATVTSQVYQRTLKQEGYRPFCIACPLLVPLVERGVFSGKEAEAAVRTYLAGLFDQSKDIRTVILGCTHYPFLNEAIIGTAKQMGHDITLVDPADEVIAPDSLDVDGAQVFLTSGETEPFSALASSLLGRNVRAGHTVISA